MGLSVAGIMTTATTLIADYYTGSVRARFLGLQSASMALGGVVFLSVGGFLADYEIAFLSMGVGYGLIGLANGYGMILVGLAITGFGLGLVVPNMNLCLTSITPGVLRGRALGGLTTCFFLGQFISPLISQPLGQMVGLGMAYILAGALVVVLALVTLAVMARSKQVA